MYGVTLVFDRKNRANRFSMIVFESSFGFEYRKAKHYRHAISSSKFEGSILKATLTRQHTETEIPELVGHSMDGLLAVQDGDQKFGLLFYVLVGGLWLRIFLDEGVLFLDACDGPDREENLDDEQAYWDLCEMYGVKGEKISEASMKHGVFRLNFESGAGFVFEGIGNDTRLRFIR